MEQPGPMRLQRMRNIFAELFPRYLRDGPWHAASKGFLALVVAGLYIR